MAYTIQRHKVRWESRGSSFEQRGTNYKIVDINIVADTFAELVAAIDELEEPDLSFSDELYHSSRSMIKGFHPEKYEGKWHVTVEAKVAN